MTTDHPLQLIQSTFRGRKVLVTGDTGFKGSWLALWLTELGAEVTGYALPPPRDNDHFCLLQLPKLIRHEDGDIRDLTRLQNVFREAQPEFVFHLAAQPLVRLSYAEPKDTFDINVGGSVNVLEAVRSTDSARVLVYVTSDKCYRNREWERGYCETDELGGHDPYSASKAAAEIVFSAYQTSYFLARPEFGAASVRSGNVIGGGDWNQDRIVPDCIKSLLDHRPILVRNPMATRPWQHVLEPLSGYLLLAARLLAAPKEYNSAWNFGPREEAKQTVGDLVRGLLAEWGAGPEAVQYAAPEARKLHEAGLLRLNCDKARKQLAWRPQWSFERTLHETVRWYCTYRDGGDIPALSRAQIKAYAAS